jgi:hypothetical protein
LNVDGTASTGVAPPDFQMEGLWQALGRLDRMLERATTAADAALGSGTSEMYRGLYITSEDVRRLVRREAGAPLLAGADPQTAAAMPVASRFPWLQQTFGLDTIDLDIILIALAPEADLRYERLFAYLQDDVTRKRPTVDLALNLLCASRDAKIVARGRFAPDAPLMRHRLLHLAADSAGPPPPLLAHALRLDDPIVRFLLGQTGLDARLQPIARFDTALVSAFTTLPTSTASTSPVSASSPSASSSPHDMRPGEADQAMLRALNAGSRPHFYLEGPASTEKDASAARLAASLHSPLLTIDLAGLTALNGDLDGTIDVLFREAQLHHAVLYCTDLDALLTPDKAHIAHALQSRLDQTGLVAIAAGERPCGARFNTLTTVAIGEPDFHQRRDRWVSALRTHGLAADDRDLDDLASRYRLTDAQIGRAVASAVRQAALGRTTPGPKDFARASRLQVRRDPGTLARKVTPFYSWNDLILPPDHVAHLKELCRQARFKHIVYGDWGFDRKLSLGKGLSALFSGPPGTGKTMAVEVIANDLGLELYKIDLSQVVSKYIGETEKNMDKLFAEARAGNAILFFDECDALFGKRTTVQDAHDRYANIEIAYLLQKLDEHEGLSILASNLRQNLDIAFTRRLTFIIEFPFPDVDSRRRLWQSIWPADVPRSRDLDLEFMATQFKLPGGAVKNIAVAAAFLAAEARTELTTEHVLWATRRELEKAGRRVARAEFGPYGDRMEIMAGEVHA